MFKLCVALTYLRPAGSELPLSASAAVAGLLKAPLRAAILCPGLVLHTCSGPAGFLIGLLHDLFGDFVAHKAKANRGVSNCVFGISSVSVKHERP